MDQWRIPIFSELNRGEAMNNKKMFNKNRCDIFNFVIQNPGNHFSDIMRQLKLTKRGLGYHLERLVAEGLIIAKPHGIFKFYYPAGYEEKPRKLTPMQKEIFDLLVQDPCTTEELSEVLGKSKKAIEYHIGNLLKLGFIARKKVDENTYHWYVE